MPKMASENSHGNGFQDRLSGRVQFLAEWMHVSDYDVCIMYCTQTGPTIPQKDRWSLRVPPPPTLKDGVLFA